MNIMVSRLTIKGRCIMRREDDIGFAVRRLANLIKRDVENNRDRMGAEHIKGVSGWAIDYFYENRESDIFQRDFEEKFSIRGSTASRMLKLMEQKGLIERVSVASDARLKKIVITEKAVEQHKKILKSIEMREKRLREGISPEDLAVFFSVMKRLTENMEEQDD